LRALNLNYVRVQIERTRSTTEMVTSLSILSGHLVSWLVVAAVALYVGVVLVSYRTAGPRYRLNLNLREPARSTQQLGVWLGVKVLWACVRIAKSTLNSLLEASAEVGEWLMRRSPAVQESVRSRFLV
jgi:hypothetical protein